MTDTSDLARHLGAALGSGYTVQRPLGEGGFGVVFLVRDLALKRDIAVKVLSPDMITSNTVLDRFRREAETIAQLSHPNIVPLHFIGQQDDLLYLAMQCVDGGSIADRLKTEERLPVNDAVRVACEVAAALAHAHRRGVIHRDIKPANVLVDAESGRCLVTDFGIARSNVAERLTATGIMVGTPAYLSPEQVTGEPIDHRVDIYALGVMLYEMLAGSVPYEAPTATAAMMKRLAGPPESVCLVRPEVPEAVAAVITTCLAADRADRFENAGEVIRALGGGEAITTGGRATLSAPAPSVARAPRSWARVAAVVAAVIAVGSAGMWTHSRGQSSTGAVTLAAVATPTDSNMVAIPAGSYAIGDDAASPYERPRHLESVAAFSIDRTEVTVADYSNYVAATRAPWHNTETAGRVPATHVPWNDAVNYCAWKHPNGGRLPTEIEWEAAARGASGRPSNTASAGRKGPVPVGSFPSGATPEGVQDLIGNVWEWTSSTLAAYTGARPLPDSMRNYRVSRGGAFDTFDSLATASFRGRLRADTPPELLTNTGFRCVVGAR